eukprot:TRINITY_DN201_c1_g1_i1.p1 TRINITY_DN201_c1_g1~~TRINITY_DN201_c1_g1_i1.p1  ORF type:complete len:411 (+),score=223.20 TRINITY_DN201_c1_g1_i1:51-1283(+)
MANSNPIITLLLILFMFSLINIGIWRFSSNDEENSTSCSNSQVISLPDCKLYTDEQECRSSRHCRPLIGSLCNSVSSTLFISCIPRTTNNSALALKMEQQQQQQQQQQQITNVWDSQDSCAYQTNKERSGVWFKDISSSKELPRGWIHDPGCKKCFNERPQVTIIVLCWNELDSLENSLKSWRSRGLLTYAKEVLLYFQEINDKKRELGQKYPNVRVLGTSENTNVAWALDYLVKESTTEYVLFLEKDWALVESFSIVKQQLDAGVELLKSGKADFIKFRSRWDAGFPNYAQSFYQGREDDVYKTQPNLLCNFYHWIQDPDWRWPDKFTRCMDSPVFYCIDSYYCNWTNNPAMWRKEWWIKWFSATAISLDRGHKHNWEGTLNWNNELWNSRAFVVAEGNGLFKHVEINE